MPIGPQDLWAGAGSNFIFKRDNFDVAGNGVLVEQPWVDFGIVDSITPTFEVSRSQLFDGGSGIQELFDSRTVRQIERFTVTTRNMSLRNWNRFVRGRRVETFSQAAQTASSKSCLHRFFPGHLVKLQDELGVDVYALANVHGVHTASPNIGQATVTNINATTREITVSQDLSGAHPATGSFVILKPDGLDAASAQANAGTYTIQSKTGTGPTVITVVESIAATDAVASDAGVLMYKSAGASTNNVSPGPRQASPAWKVGSLADGTIYAVMGGAISTEVDLVVSYSLAAISSGSRLVLPQTLKGDVRGRMHMFWSRNGYEEITVRRSRCIITGDSAQVVVEGDQFSGMTFQVETLTEEGAADPDGDLVYVKGALPALT